MSTVGKRILQRRKELDITQEELARMMGYKSKSTINKIEMGINDIPQSKIIKFAEVLLTTPSFLMGWDEEEDSPEELKLTEGERIVLDLFNRVPKDKQEELVLQMIRFALGTTTN
ncbi:MAG: helix-turn-helix domain-containing protein [Ruminococcaceae bacterium]|nr:helix-turn-helix domain-containing protein [Oscillospiraceae bacterium]